MKIAIIAKAYAAACMKISALLIFILVAASTYGENKPVCGDFLEMTGHKPDNLEFISCDKIYVAPVHALEAVYRVKGMYAKEIEAYFVKHTGMPHLKYMCCGWSNHFDYDVGRHYGVLRQSLWSENDTADYLQITMTTGETREQNWDRIEYFYVEATLFIESP